MFPDEDPDEDAAAGRPAGTAEEENLDFEAFRGTVAQADKPPGDDFRLSS
jgi:hypothetical protein